MGCSSSKPAEPAACLPESAALFFNGELCLLDLPQAAPPGAATGKPARSPLAPLVMEGLEEVQTVYEGDFGRPLADVYCLSPAAGGAPPLLGCSL